MKVIKQFFISKNVLYLYLALVLVISFTTYFFNYDKPAYLFWDENYHIASAQKYLDNVMFSEPHPPLGKLLIAFSEKITGANKDLDKSAFNDTDYISSIPAGYTFKGVRLPSTLLATFGAVLFFLLLFYLFSNPHLAFCFSSLYLFENALIVHSRSAMLEGQHFFFILAAMAYFAFLLKKNKELHFYHYLVLGVLVGLVICIKVNGGILLLLFVFLIGYEYRENLINRKIDLKLVKQFCIKTLSSIAGLLLVVFAVFYIHFALTGTIKNNRTYKATTDYLRIIREGKTANPLNFVPMMKHYMFFMQDYQKGVPKLDLTKPGENGSHPIGWPLGVKSINYRWNKNKNQVKYLYLQGNPLIWFSGLLGVLLSLSLISGRIFFKTRITNHRLFALISFFTLLYGSYMFTMLRIDRVMYLYHYFIPLLFSFVLAYLMFVYILEELILKKNKFLFLVLPVCILLIFLTYCWFSPFTYYFPLREEEFMARVWFDFWKLTPIR